MKEISRSIYIKSREYMFLIEEGKGNPLNIYADGNMETDHIIIT